jgi:hypothetical protein
VRILLQKFHLLLLAPVPRARLVQSLRLELSECPQRLQERTAPSSTVAVAQQAFGGFNNLRRVFTDLPAPVAQSTVDTRELDV